MWHITRLSPYPALNRFTFHAPASSYSTLLVNDNQRRKQKADSREPGGKQDKDTGDLFFTSTSLTKNPLLTMFSWLPNLASPPSHRLGAAFLLNTGIMRRQGAVLETWLLLSLNLYLRFTCWSSVTLLLTFSCSWTLSGEERNPATYHREWLCLYPCCADVNWTSLPSLIDYYVLNKQSHCSFLVTVNTLISPVDHELGLYPFHSIRLTL